MKKGGKMSKKNLRLLILGIIVLVIVVAVIWYYRSTISGGVVVYKSCVDSDGGQNYAVKGIVRYGDNSFEDECRAVGYIAEAYCKKNIYSGVTHPAIELYQCSLGCEAGACK